MSFKGSAFQKILTGLIIFNTVGLVGILGGGFYAYKYVTSDNFEKMIKNKIMGDIQNVLPEAIQSEIPDTTGISIPF